MLTLEEPEYSKVAARFLMKKIKKELIQLNIGSFSESIAYGYSQGLIGQETLEFVSANQVELNAMVKASRNDGFQYIGLRTVYDRYLLKDPLSRLSVESPQFFMMRVACGLAKSTLEAKEFYDLMSGFDYLPSTPTLFNSGTKRPQMSSCYLIDSPLDSLESIYQRYTEVAKLSKYAGGIGMAYHRVRGRGSLIKGTNGHSNGIIPFLKTLDSSINAVNQGGKRKGACCVYLENWHSDIKDFLDLRENTGDESMRTHNLNLANWVSDLFMKRVEQDADWSLFDPKDVPDLCETWGDAFEKVYTDAEKAGLAQHTVKARELYSRMMKCLAQTGNGWMTFKDHSNRKANQTKKPENVIHLSNLCTEILEVTSDKEIAVCNLGSINLRNYVDGNKFLFDKLGTNVEKAVKYLDRVVDINFYPVEKAKDSNSRWRPVGLGVVGLQDVFFKLGLAFDSKEALELSTQIQEYVYYHACRASLELAKKDGKHSAFDDTRAADGDLQFDLWGVTPSRTEDWANLRKEIKKHGLRNSLMIAIAPTATIACIMGSYECIEPQISNLFKKETLSGEFIQINPYLVRSLRERDLWTKDIKDKIKMADGSIQGIEEIPEDVRKLYRTAWEIPMKSLIDMAAARGAYIDQSQSLNLFMESPTIGKLSSMYMYAWKKGIKTTYYLRARPATKIRKTTVNSGSAAQKKYTEEEALACSLENPESCDACQ
jgi:ribonucleoside-diphosphate reductase alpha chain